MPIQLTLKQQKPVRVNVAGFCPSKIAGLTLPEIELLPIWSGHKTLPLKDIFHVEDLPHETDADIIFAGSISSVDGIGQSMDGGTIRIVGDAGSNVGHSMSGGTISVAGNVGHFAGSEMTGGQLFVDGNAGDFLGANCPGSTFGMNRGTITIRGNVGDFIGRRMRRGTIVVYGNVGQSLGWEMLAGTLIVFGTAGVNVGLEMKRGTIILAGTDALAQPIGPMFSKGRNLSPPTFPNSHTMA